MEQCHFTPKIPKQSWCRCWTESWEFLPGDTSLCCLPPSALWAPFLALPFTLDNTNHSCERMNDCEGNVADSDKKVKLKPETNWQLCEVELTAEDCSWLISVKTLNVCSVFSHEHLSCWTPDSTSENDELVPTLHEADVSTCFVILLCKEIINCVDIYLRLQGIIPAMWKLNVLLQKHYSFSTLSSYYSFIIGAGLQTNADISDSLIGSLLETLNFVRPSINLIWKTSIAAHRANVRV